MGMIIPASVCPNSMYLGQGMGAAQSVRQEGACRHPYK